MIKGWFERLRLGGNSSENSKPSVEEAVRAWENDHEKNQEGYKIVRGLDGQPVEVVLYKKGEKPIFAILVNGMQLQQFQIGGKMQKIEDAFGNLRIEQFLNSNVFDRWYELKGVKRLDANVGRTHQGFVFGLPGVQPENIRVSFRGA